MNPQDLEQQQRLQAAAERAEREGLPAGDPQVDAYRLIWRALQQPLSLSLPADFAQQVARKLQMREESADVERWLTNAMLVTLAFAAALFGLPPLAASLAEILRSPVAQSLPWTSMFVAAFGLVVVWLTDAALSAKWRPAR